MDVWQHLKICQAKQTQFHKETPRPQQLGESWLNSEQLYK
jgi:hypothetical protein